MAFLGHLDFKDERNPSQTTALVLQRCLEGTGKDIETFLKGLLIDPSTFFSEINADWHRRPFIGQHVFRVLQVAGYKGTEHDIWELVTGTMAPYPIKRAKADARRRAARAIGLH
jgi:hypothetical protein